MLANKQLGLCNTVPSKLDLFNTNVFSQLHYDYVIIAVWIMFTGTLLGVRNELHFWTLMLETGVHILCPVCGYV